MAQEPDAPADLATLKTFFWWYASNSDGRIGKRPTIQTMIFGVQKLSHVQKIYYGYKVSDDILDNIREVSWLFAEVVPKAYQAS
jgi:hypothetical protein